MKKKGSLNLSINAVVIIVLAITMLGLGLGFIRGIFGGGLDQVEEQIKQLEKQRIDSLLEDCEDQLCLETYKIDIEQNEQKDTWAAIYNKFDCDINDENQGEVSIMVAGHEGGSSNFEEDECEIIGSLGECSDIIIETRKTKDISAKSKDAILVRIKAKSKAERTVYSYDLSIDGECEVSGVAEPFELRDKVTLDVNVVG